MHLAEFISTNGKRIAAEWVQFAGTCLPAATTMDLDQRRDHVEGMLCAIALDLASPQTRREQADKAAGNSDAAVGSDTAANLHGTDRAAMGFTPSQMVSEFRALRASVLRLWAAAQPELDRANLDEVTRFNEAIDQALAESMARYSKDVARATDLLLGVLGHDLRTPLGAIMMSATLMITKEGTDWAHHKVASRILSSGTRMDAMIGDLVDFARSRLGAGMPIARAEIDMDVIVRQTIDEITAFHPSSTVHYTSAGEQRGLWDAGRVGQALSNLLGNAFQHGAPGVPIDVTLRGEPGAIVLSVHNRGPAIPPSRQQDIFNPYRQLDPGRAPARNQRSVGLGLYIVDAIVIAHEGSIHVESGEGGTTFTVRLPRGVV